MMRTRPRCFSARLPFRETLRSNVSLILLLIAVIALSSCSAMKVKLGMRVDLTKVDVASIDARMANSPGVAPGQKAPLIVTVTAIGPADVGTISSRTPDSMRSAATARSSGVQSRSTKPNLLPE